MDVLVFFDLSVLFIRLTLFCNFFRGFLLRAFDTGPFELKEIQLATRLC